VDEDRLRREGGYGHRDRTTRHRRSAIRFS
jgi:hypothetical protein